MTEDQIKAMARKLVEGDILPEITLPLIEDVIRQILEDYCIAEREKVEQEYVYASGRSDQGGYYDGKAEVLEQLFGTSMFNENE